MVKIIAFNGPPGSGKDTGAEYFMKRYKANVLTLAKPIYEMVSRIYGIPIHDLYEHKSKPHSLLGEKTTREVMTFWGEQTKYLHGQDVWINKVINEIRKRDKRFSFPFYVISDLGFQIELDRLADEFGAENIKIIRLFRDGCNFNFDSRDYIIPHSFVTEFMICKAIKNNGTIAEYETKLKTVVEEWLTK